MLYVKIMDFAGEVDIDDLTDVGVGEALYECKSLIDKLEDKHRELADDN